MPAPEPSAAELRARLLERGVVMPAPDLVHVGPEVDPERIAPGAELHPGTVLLGRDTLLGAHAAIGREGPAVVRNCALGAFASLASGSFEDAVLLEGARFGPSGHARGGTLFEEGASAAHATGTKQTVLLPFATLGSDVNFCDALLAGGRDAKDHSEVGSGCIHFNFTPHGPAGDKATASLFGDVPRGVWLREDRVFVGGAGGVVGPVRVGFGSVLAAGSVFRRDRGEGMLVLGEKLPPREMPFEGTILKRVGERVGKQLDYLGQLHALRSFHDLVRRRLAAGEDFALGLVDAACAALDSGRRERVKQIGRLVSGLEASVEALGATRGPEDPERRIQERLLAVWGELSAELVERPVAGEEDLAAVLDAVPAGGARYLDWVRELPDAVVAAGRSALERLAAAPRAVAARHGFAVDARALRVAERA